MYNKTNINTKMFVYVERKDKVEFYDTIKAKV